jgi:hypothetical protein
VAVQQDVLLPFAEPLSHCSVPSRTLSPQTARRIFKKKALVSIEAVDPYDNPLTCNEIDYYL